MARKINVRSPTEFDKALGERIGKLMKERGVTQQALGKAVGVTYQQISKYVNGDNRLGVWRFLQICSALGVDPPKILAEI